MAEKYLDFEGLKAYDKKFKEFLDKERMDIKDSIEEESIVNLFPEKKEEVNP